MDDRQVCLHVDKGSFTSDAVPRSAATQRNAAGANEP